MEGEHRSRWREIPYRLLRKYPPPPVPYWWAARAMNQQFLLGVLGVIRDDRDQVLLFHHTYREPAWSLPAGWMVLGESPLQAIEREVLEESGLIARADRLLLVGTISDRPKLEFVVDTRIVGGEFRPSTEVNAAGWWPMAEVPGTVGLKALLARVACLAPGEVGQYHTTWALNRQG